jgi:Rap1a immunity proteins
LAAISGAAKRLALRHVPRLNAGMPDSQLDFSTPAELRKRTFAYMTMARRSAMRRLAISGCAFVLLASLFFGSARADPNFDSGNFMLPHCKQFAMGEHAEVWEGQCGGVISALMFLGTSLNEQSRFCPPKKVTLGQAGRVVVNYMNAHPELLHLDFRGLAVTALQEAWPCK